MSDGNDFEKEAGYQYDFCPKCGALTREGTCTSCGRHWEKPQNVAGNSVNYNETNQYGANPGGTNPYGMNQNGSNQYGTKQNGSRNMGPGYNSQNNNIPNYNGQSYAGNQGYGQPQSVPAYMASNQYGPVKKNNTVFIIILCIIGAFMLLGVIVFVGLVAYGLGTEEVSTSYTEYDKNYSEIGDEYSDPIEGYSEDDVEDDTEYSYDYTTIDGFDYYTDYNYFFEDDYTSSWGVNHDNHTYEDFQGDYYEGICDYIDESQDYKVDYQYVTYQSPDSNMYAGISYVVLGGDGITNLEEVNAAIKEESLYLAKMYVSEYIDQGYTDEILIIVDSYVTYTDENVISIVLDEYISVNEDYQFDLYSINIDIKNCYIIDNATMLDVNNDLVKEFRTNAEWQNSDAYCMEILTNEDIFTLLDSEALIVFYNPYGLEIGVNYYTDETDYGWITATFTDYENYLSHF